MMGYKDILIIEDEDSIRDSLADILTEKGYMVAKASCLKEVEAVMDRWSFRLLLIDVCLPDGSGFDFCRKVRQNSVTPIIFLTSSDDEQSIIEGLGAGGNDYVTKPFRLGELLARIKANIERHESVLDHAKDIKTTILEIGEISFNLSEGRVQKSGVELSLRKKELDILQFFMENPGILLTRDKILSKIWGIDGDFVDDNTLTVEISRLRRKLGSFNGQAYIETIRGVGYRFIQK